MYFGLRGVSWGLSGTPKAAGHVYGAARRRRRPRRQRCGHAGMDTWRLRYWRVRRRQTNGIHATGVRVASRRSHSGAKLRPRPRDGRVIDGRARASCCSLCSRGARAGGGRGKLRGVYEAVKKAVTADYWGWGKAPKTLGPEPQSPTPPATPQTPPAGAGQTLEQTPGPLPSQTPGQPRLPLEVSLPRGPPDASNKSVVASARHIDSSLLRGWLDQMGDLCSAGSCEKNAEHLNSL